MQHQIGAAEPTRLPQCQVIRIFAGQGKSVDAAAICFSSLQPIINRAWRIVCQRIERAAAAQPGIDPAPPLTAIGPARPQAGTRRAQGQRQRAKRLRQQLFQPQSQRFGEACSSAGR